MTKSHPQQYGDQKMRPEPLSFYQAADDSLAIEVPLHKRIEKIQSAEEVQAVSSRDVDLALLLHDVFELDGAEAQEAQVKLDEEVARRVAADKLHADIVRMAKPAHVSFDDLMEKNYRTINAHSYYPMMGELEAWSGELTDYSAEVLVHFHQAVRCWRHPSHRRHVGGTPVLSATGCQYPSWNVWPHRDDVAVWTFSDMYE